MSIVSMRRNAEDEPAAASGSNRGTTVSRAGAAGAAAGGAGFGANLDADGEERGGAQDDEDDQQRPQPRVRAPRSPPPARRRRVRLCRPRHGPSSRCQLFGTGDSTPRPAKPPLPSAPRRIPPKCLHTRAPPRGLRPPGPLNPRRAAGAGPLLRVQSPLPSACSSRRTRTTNEETRHKVATVPRRRESERRGRSAATCKGPRAAPAPHRGPKFSKPADKCLRIIYINMIYADCTFTSMAVRRTGERVLEAGAGRLEPCGHDGPARPAAPHGTGQCQ